MFVMYLVEKFVNRISNRIREYSIVHLSEPLLEFWKKVLKKKIITIIREKTGKINDK